MPSRPVSPRASGLSAALFILMPCIAFAQLQGGFTYPVNGVENPPVSFGTVQDAVSYLVTNGATGTGQVILELGSGYGGETAPVTIPPITGLGSTLGLTLRPAAGASPITSIHAFGSDDWAFLITGSYITFDGRAGGTGPGGDWTIRCLEPLGGAGDGESAVRIEPDTDPVTTVAIRHCILEAESPVTGLGIVALLVGTDPVSGITLEHNTIRSTGVTTLTTRDYAISLTGNNSGSTGLVIAYNRISNFSASGIRFIGLFPGALIRGNEFYHTTALTQDQTREFAAIYFQNSQSPGVQIIDNFIHDIQLTNAVTAVSGIRVEQSNPSGTRLRIANNRVAIGSGIGFAIPVWGIRDESSDPVDVDFNSIYIGGTIGSGTSNSAAFARQGGTTAIRDNIFYNARSNTGSATGTHWGILLGNLSGPPVLANNDYLADGTGGILGTTTATTSGNRPTLADWVAAVPQDSLSVSQDPHFLDPTASPPDLKLDPVQFTRLESGGAAIAGIDADFEGDIRQGSAGYGGSGSAPDIGADEGENEAIFPVDVEVGGVFPFPGTEIVQGQSVTPYAAVLNVGLDDLTDVPVRFLLRGPDPDTSAYYEELVTVPTLDVGDTVTVPFPQAVLNLSGTFTMTARAEMPGDGRAENDEFSGSLIVLGPLAGTFDVGAAQAPPFNTLTGALNRLGQVGMDGPVVLQLVDPSYGPSENIPIYIQNIQGADSTNTLTIRPAPGVTTTIAASSDPPVLYLNEARHVILDGSNNGGTSRDLTIQNTNLINYGACVWGAGASHITVKNLNVTGLTGIGIGFGDASILPTGGDIDNFDITIQNCAVRKVYHGIVVSGGGTMGFGPGSRDVVIVDNLLDASGADVIRQTGILGRFLDSPVITGNRIRVSGAESPALGISLGLAPESNLSGQFGAKVDSATVSGNDILGVATTSSGASAVGIALAPANTGTTHLSNNTVSGVISTAFGTELTAGIYAAAGTVDPGEAIEIAFNSVAMTGARGNFPNPSYALVTNGLLNLDQRNNILYNTQTSTGGAKSYAIALLNAPSSLVSDHNVFHVAGAQGVLGRSGGVDLADLASWQAGAPGAPDSASFQGDPRFVNAASDLHIDTSIQATSPAANGGIPVAWVTVDLDGESRMDPPDIGADEFTTYSLSTSVAGSGSIAPTPDYPTYNPGASVLLAATPDPGSYFAFWSGDASGTANPYPLIMNGDRSVTAQFRPQIAVTVADTSVVEGNTGTIDAVFTVVLGGAPLDTLQVSYATQDSTATLADADYTAQAGTLVFAPGDSTPQTIVVPVQGDSAYEPNELFRLELATTSGGALASATALGTILNDDAAPVLNVGDTTLVEGNGQLPGYIEFGITLAGGLGDTITVDYDVVDGSAQENTDYYFGIEPGAGTLVFPPGGPTLRTVRVEIIQDQHFETAEAFSILLSNPLNAALADSEGVCTILNDDGPPRLSIQAAAVQEGNTGQTSIQFQVSQNVLSYQTVTAEVSTADATAQVADGDYGPLVSVQVQIAPGQLSTSVWTSVNGDSDVEPTEYFHAILSGIQNAVPLDTLSYGVLADDDGGPSISLGDIAMVEGNPNSPPAYALIPLLISAAVTEGEDAFFETLDGTATSAERDYQPVTSGHVFVSPAPAYLQFIAVEIDRDFDIEPDENFFVQLLPGTTVPIADSLGECTILNDDALDIEPPSVTVLSPNGGESWLESSQHTILWTATDNQQVALVDIEYSIDGGSTWLPIIMPYFNSGSYPWTLPMTPTTTARVRVTAHDLTGNPGSDMSDAHFAIEADISPPSVTLESPNGGEVWPVGGQRTIQWNAFDNVEVVSADLEYSSNGGASWSVIATGLPAGGGPMMGGYSWIIPGPPTTTARVRVIVYDTASNAASDTSDADFTVEADTVPPSVTLYFPNGGESWLAGSQQQVVWTASDNARVTALDLEVSTDGGQSWTPSVTGLTNTGSSLWRVPATPSLTARVRITAHDPAGFTAQDASDADFTILADTTAPQLTLYSPNGGETWVVGSQQFIGWSAYDEAGVVGVDLEYSTDGGDTWIPVAAGVGGFEGYPWTVPTTPTGTARVRATATDYSGNAVADTSDTDFTIAPDLAPPTVQVYAPNGGEVWPAGSEQIVYWLATDNAMVAEIDLEYSVDGGDSWIPVASPAPTSYSYNWTIPDTPTGTALLRATARDPSDLEASDVADGYFSITSTTGIGDAPLRPFLSLGPNPFRSSTTISFALEEPGPVGLTLYDLQGRQVAILLEQDLPSGLHRVDWDPRSRGIQLAAGVYFLRLEAGGRVFVKKAHRIP